MTAARDSLRTATPAPAGPPPYAQVEAVHFAYETRPVLRDVSFGIAPGEFVGLAGPNGAGKSTLIRLLSGVRKPSAGEIRIEGKPLARLGRIGLARRVAVVPQLPVLPPAFTALELVQLGRTPHLRLLQREGPRDRAIVEAALAATDATALAHRRLGELSGGERQRVVIARALAQEPRLLLLDEPTAHLDLAHQVATLDLTRRLARERGLAVLAVFHDLSLAAQYCDRLILLAAGTILADGPPAQVLSSAVLQQAYGVDVLIVPHPRTGRPLVVPLANESEVAR